MKGDYNMPCYSPKSVTMENGKIEKWHNHINHNNKYVNMFWKKMTFIPCKNCIGCKTEKAKEWALRAQLEAQKYEHNYFITLTYKDEYLPLTENGKMTTSKKDFTKFVNTLRKHFERKNHTGIKYLSGNEYGTIRGRPHYHGCFFNLPLNDLKPTGEKNEIGQPYYTSPLIEKIWKKGMIVIGKCTYESAGYTTRYSLKKMKKNETDKAGIEPERLRMSKGIGKDYFLKNWQEIYKHGHITIKTNKGIKNVKPPQYFDRLLKNIEPELLEKIKLDRKEKALIKTENEIINSKMTYTQIQGVKQHQLHENLKKLKSILKNKN